jgi:hypothetical protein
MRLERQKPGLSDCRNLRRVLQIENDTGRSLAVVVCNEISCFRFKIRQDSLNRRTQSSSLYGGIAGFHGNRCPKQHAHTGFLLQGRHTCTRGRTRVSRRRQGRADETYPQRSVCPDSCADRRNCTPKVRHGGCAKMGTLSGHSEDFVDCRSVFSLSPVTFQVVRREPS